MVKNYPKRFITFVPAGSAARRSSHTTTLNFKLNQGVLLGFICTGENATALLARCALIVIRNFSFNSRMHTKARGLSRSLVVQLFQARIRLSVVTSK